MVLVATAHHHLDRTQSKRLFEENSEPSVEARKAMHDGRKKQDDVSSLEIFSVFEFCSSRRSVFKARRRAKGISSRAPLSPFFNYLIIQQCSMLNVRTIP